MNGEQMREVLAEAIKGLDNRSATVIILSFIAGELAEANALKRFELGLDAKEDS